MKRSIHKNKCFFVPGYFYSFNQLVKHLIGVFPEMFNH